MSLPNHIGVFGGGRMGTGITHAFLAHGSRVTVVERDRAAADAARSNVLATLTTAAGRGALNGEPTDILQRLDVSTDPAALAGAELVIEAVPEALSLKVAVLQAAAAVVPAAALASNTSSLSIGEIAAQLPDPSRLIGLHFFNPVPTSDLVEIVVGAITSRELVAAAREWVSDLAKTAITVTDTPGFASSRLGVGLALEAMRMVEDGVASASDIDKAMTLGYRHPTGPLKTTDIVGLDVRLAIAEHLAKELGPRFEPPAILRSMVASGLLGRKSGQGFYKW
jgi:3-hydroxybutyryl-CoA dehydrogenase